MLFKDIIGQIQLKEQLINTVNQGRISHAQLFQGQYGFGTFALALAYVQYICCSNKQSNDSCGECVSCKKIEKLIHPDVHFSFPVNTNEKNKKSKPTSDLFLEEWRSINLNQVYFSIDDWMRYINIENKQGIINVEESQSILKKLSLKPYESEFKFLLIWGADKMNTQAANKLLKLIEEPQEKTIILLITDRPEFLLKTITSRTQIIQTPPISTDALIHALAHQTNSEQAISIAKQVNGNYISALNKINTQVEEADFFEWFKIWMRVCYKADIQGMHKWVEDVSSGSVGREKRKRFLQYALNLMREALMRSYTNSNLQSMFGSQDQFIERFQPFVHRKNVIQMNEILNEAHQDISRNAYAKIVFMDLSMKFANLLHVKS